MNAAANALALSDIVDVVISVSPQLPATPTFNQGLIIGTSTVIPSVAGAGILRVRQYTSTAAMLTDGFSVNSPEYIAAGIYFGQAQPAQILWVGRQDLTAISTITLGATPGTGYAVGDTGLITQAGASLGTYIITAVDAGVPTGVAILSGAQGTGYALGNNVVTTVLTGAGSGTLTIDITALGESCLQAVVACRIASPNWWSVVALAAEDADSIAIAAWAQSAVPQSMYMYTTGTVGILSKVAGNVMATLQTASYTRAFGIFATTQNGLYPNNIYAAVAAMGVAMGLNTGLANSYFTLKFKVLTGITPEPWTEANKAVVEGYGGNCYVNYGNAYNWLEQGTVASGQFFDEILNFDMLASDYQYSVIDVLVANPSVGQDEAGQTLLLATVDGANSRAASRGFIAPGIWTGAQILNLVSGTALPNGYLSQSAAYSTQSPANRQARQAMPIYVAIIEAGAVHSVMIGVYVQR